MSYLLCSYISTVFIFCFFLFVFCFVFQDRVSLCSPGYLGTHYVDQTGFKLSETSLPLPPEFWDSQCVPPLPSFSLNSVVNSTEDFFLPVVASLLYLYECQTYPNLPMQVCLLMVAQNYLCNSSLPHI